MPLSIKLDKELHERLIEVSNRLGIAKHRLAEMAIEAATQAIERNGYRLVVPIEFEVTHEATKKTSQSYPTREVGHPEHKGEFAPTEDRDPNSPSKKTSKAEEILDVIEKYHPSKPARRK